MKRKTELWRERQEEEKKRDKVMKGKRETIMERDIDGIKARHKRDQVKEVYVIEMVEERKE